MADDRASRTRTPRIQSDTDRALQPRPRTSPGVPDHEIEHELTPLNLRVERLSARVDSLVTEAAANSEAIGEFMKPAIKSMMAKLDTIVEYHQSNKPRTDLFYDEQWPDLVHRFKGMDDRLGRAERTLEKHGDSNAGLVASVVSLESVGRGHDGRITALERVNADTTLASRVAGQERNRLFTWARAAVIAAVAGVSFLAAKLPELIAWIRK